MENQELLVTIGTICGYIAGILTVLSLIPQIITMYKTKDPKGISMLTIIALWIVSALNLIYGTIIISWPLILTNVFTTIMWAIIFFLKIYYTKKLEQNQENDSIIYEEV